MAVTFSLNGRRVRYAGYAETPLLWVIREDFGLRGTKFGCGKGICGACTVHLDGQAVRSCSVPVGSADGTAIRTIEGMATGDTLHPVQQAWLEIDVPQCGFCQPGQIMAAASLLSGKSAPTDAEIAGEMTNICRCGTYRKIKAAIRRAEELLRQEQPSAA